MPTNHSRTFLTVDHRLTAARLHDLCRRKMLPHGALLAGCWVSSSIPLLLIGIAHRRLAIGVLPPSFHSTFSCPLDHLLGRATRRAFCC